MASATDDIEDIRRMMAQIRRELHDDVRGVVEGAEAATDPMRYLKMYPWATVGLALAVGYFIVPKRKKTTAEIVERTLEARPELAARVEIPSERVEKEKQKKKGWGLMGALFGLVSPIAVRMVQGYALQYFENWLAQQSPAMMAMGMMAGQQGQAQQGPQPGTGPTPRPGQGPYPGQPPGGWPGMGTGPAGR